jgi:hypothetical protein
MPHKKSAEMCGRDSGNGSQLLFKFKKGTVTAEIHGPRLGWKWRIVRYYRWQKCSKEAAAWNQVLPDRAVDQPHLEQCVKAVRAWLKQDETSAS